MPTILSARTLHRGLDRGRGTGAMRRAGTPPLRNHFADARIFPLVVQNGASMAKTIAACVDFVARCITILKDLTGSC